MERATTLLKKLVEIESKLHKYSKEDLDKAFANLEKEGISPLTYTFLYEIWSDLEYWDE